MRKEKEEEEKRIAARDLFYLGPLSGASEFSCASLLLDWIGKIYSAARAWTVLS